MKHTILLAVALFFIVIIGLGLFFDRSPVKQGAPPVRPQKPDPQAEAKAEVTTFTNTEPIQEAAQTNYVHPINYRAPKEFGKEAYYIARAAIQRSLKSPSSAKFSNPLNQSDTGWNSDGYYQWRVGGRVEAQNSFGAMIEQRWFAVVQYNLGNFEIVYSKLGDDERGKMPGMRLAPGVK